ncbi:MAG: nucleotidyltransferase domain-containing protein [Rhodocyclaceae bacterium]|nr:nucleotidyltransferase domain-containing protein [Rhodocyclaceae bacterium]
MIREVLGRHRARLAGRRVFLFGSRARGTARPRSDFDIGVIGEQALPLADFYAIADEFEALPTLYRIDWVDMNRVADEFRARAMQHTQALT